MPKTIFLRVGTHDRVPLYVFIDSCRNFLSVLQHLDAAVSRDPRGSMIWEVVSLQKNSPPVVGVAPYQKPSFKKKGYQDFSELVEGQLIESASLLDIRGERSEYISDAALGKIKNLAKKTRRVGPMGLYIDGTRIVENPTVITERTLRNVEQLIGVKYSAYGSFVGSLDSISVHRGMEFRVWDETTHKPVLCKFIERDLDQVKDLLQKRVTVAGIVNSNSAGSPVSISIEQLEPAPMKKLPTIEEMSGLVEDFTEGKTLKQYMEDLADE